MNVRAEGIFTMGYARKEQLARHITLALTTGLFSIVPVVAEGAPVLDQVVTPEADVSTSGKITDVTSTVQNNIVKWEDFSVAKGETVRFDQGAQTNNYLNIVTGTKQSDIDGMITGGKDVYIVNPHGVLIDENATVNVGNLYVSTAPPSALDTATFEAGGSPLANTASQAAGAVTNLGKISATSVSVEGTDIKFMDTADVTATAVDLEATNNIRLGQRASVTRGNYALPSNYTTNVTPSYFGTIKNQADLSAISSNLSGTYEQANNITLSGKFSPIAENSPFTGTYDGNYHTISNLNVSDVNYGGLFGQAKGATIKNVGIVGGNINAGTEDDNGNPTGAAGGLVGYASATYFENVFNQGVTVTSNNVNFAGGIVGVAKNGTIVNQAYNTGYIDNGSGGGIVGIISASTVKNAYNANSAQSSGIVGEGESEDTSSVIENVYTTGAEISGSYGATKTNAYKKASGTSKDDYKGFDISDSGSDNTVWRIYEGKTMPLLRDMLRRGSSSGVTVNYTYTMGDQTGTNGGADLTGDNALTYNNNDLVLSDVTYTNPDITVDSKKISTAGTFRNANSYNFTDLDGNPHTSTAKDLVYYYCDQDGYDLIGNNIAITPITVDLQNTLGKTTIDKEYNGKSDVTTTKLAELFNNSTSSGSGILKGDTTASIGLSSDFTAVYATASSDGTLKDGDGNLYAEEKNVGTDREILITKGGASLTYNGAYNYILSSDSQKLEGQHFGGNTISQKKVYVDLGDTLKNTANVTKTYNKSAALPTTLNLSSGDFSFDTSQFVDKNPSDNTKGKEDVQLAFASSNPTGEYVAKDASTGKYVADGTASQDKDVAYYGLMLSGGDAKNYVLIDNSDKTRTLWQEENNGVGSDVNKDTGGTLFGKGVINKRSIGNTGYSWYENANDTTPQAATREYNGLATYTAPEGHIVKNNEASSGDTGIIQGDSVIFTVDSANFIKSTDDSDTTTTKNVKEAKGVAYNVVVTGDDLENYKIGDEDITSGQTNTVYGDGKITPRTLNVVAKAGVDKYYDGDDVVKVNGLADNLSFGGDQVAYADASDTDHHLLANDTNAKIAVTGKYASAKVEWKDDAPTAQQITYTVKVMEGNDVSENYAFNADGATSIDLTNQSGTIKPRAITKVAFQDVSKIYDQTNTVNGKQTSDTIALDADKTVGLVNGESAADIIDISKVKGTYGSYDSTAKKFTPNEGGHVAYLDKAQTQVAAQDVEYTGLALKNPQGNYILATADEGGTAYTTAYGTGTIHPLEITDASTINLAIKTPITKVYDNSASVANGSNTAKSYVGDLTAKIPNSTDSITLGYTVAGANYASKNSGNQAKQDVTYNLNITADAEGHKDYTIANNLLESDGTLKKTLKESGVITPYTLKASVVHDSLDKEYDTTTVLKDANGNALSGDSIVTLEGLFNDRTTNASTGLYDDSDVAYDSDGNVTSRGITYTAAILGGDDLSNYTIDQTTLKGDGTITPHALTLDLGPSSKIYDGTTTLADNVTADVSGTLGSDQITLNLDKTQSAYADANKGENKKATYVFTLSGDKVGNYKLTTDTLTDTPAKADTTYRVTTKDNVISVKALGLNDIDVNWGNITKVYDGSANVGYDHTDTKTYFGDEVGKKSSADFINYTAGDKTATGLKLGGISIARGTGTDGYTVTDDASYGTGNTGVGTHQATFHFDLGSTVQDNFDFTALEKAGVYKDGKLTQTHDGTITQKILKASFDDAKGGNTKNGAVTKVYNGKTDVVTNSQADTAGSAVANLLDKISYQGLVGTDATADIGTIAGKYDAKDVTAKGAADNVTYTLTKTNANYKMLKSTDDLANASDAPLTFTGTGIITPKEITATFGKVTKTYDKTAAIDGTDARDFGATLSDDLQTDDDGNLDVVTIAADAKASSYVDRTKGDAANAGTDKLVNYVFSLGGKDLGNYTLTNSGVTTNDDGTRSITTDGNTIEKKTINGITVTFNTIEKTYDGTNAVAYDHTSSDYFTGYDDADRKDAIDFIQGISFDDLTLDKNKEYTVSSATYGSDTDDGKSAGKHDATFAIDFDSSVFDNYIFTDFQQGADGKGHLTKTETGMIHAKYVKTSFKDNPVSKVYNGKTDIVTNSQDDVTGTAVSNATLFNDFTYSGLLNGETKDGISTVAGAYNSANATHSDADAENNVTYTLTNNNANYILVKDTDAKDKAANTLTYTGKGTIEQKNLEVTDVTTSAGGAVEKFYDNSADVKDVASLTYELDGLIDKDNSFTLNSTAVGNNVKGTYGSKNVNRTANAATGEAGKDKQGNPYYYRDVTYQGFQNALDEMYKGGDTIAGNYSIADTAYFDEAAKRGVIKPISITSGAVRTQWSDITKPYDGNANVANGDLAKAAEYLKYSVLVSADGTARDAGDAEQTGDFTVNIPYTLDKATYNQKNAGKNLTAEYVISDFEGTALQNFDMGDDVKNVVVGTKTKTGDAATDISITPRLINVTLTTQEGVDKVYNANTDSTFANGITVTNGNIEGETNPVNVALVSEYGTYDSKNASQDKEDRTVTYKVELTGNAAGNYTLGNSDRLASDGKGGATETKELTATGTIAKRKVYVDFQDGTAPTGIDKTYGETTAASVYPANAAAYDAAKREVLHPEDYRKLVVTRDDTTTADDGILAGDDVAFDQDAVTMQYEDGNVHRDSSGKATTQAVLFDTLQLKDTNGGDNAKNYEIAIFGGKQQLTGSGTITPATVHVTIDNTDSAAAVSKEYDATTKLTAEDLDAVQQNVTPNDADMMLGESINDLGLTVSGSYADAHANRTDKQAEGQKGVNYTLNWTNKNYDIAVEAKDSTDAATHAMTAAQVTAPTNSVGGTATATVAQGTITPRLLAITGARDVTEDAYDGTTKVKKIDSYGNLIFGHADAAGNVISGDVGVIDSDKTANAFAVTDTGTYYDATNTTLDGNAGVDGDTAADSKDLRDHKVRYTDINIKNTDYELNDPNYTQNGYALGNGKIQRAKLTVKTPSVEGRYGQTPTFTGTVDGFVGDDKKSFDASSMHWNIEPGVTTREAQKGVPIYGWYADGTTPQRDMTAGGGNASAAAWYKDVRPGYATDGKRSYRNFGNYGLNYVLDESALGTYTAQADGPNTDILNPARRVRPDMEVFNHVSHDENGTAIRDPKAGIEYQAGGTSLSADGSAAYAGTMTVTGAGDIVNLTQSGTTASADRVDLTNDGANYTLSGAENVPTADVTVADVTEDVASATTTASATAAAGTTSATSATNADDTTVTDDDDDAVKAAAESSDEREAEATVEYADQAPSLFSEAITGTNVAS